MLRYGDDLDVSVNIAAVADYLEDCAQAQAAEPPSPLPDHSLRHLVRGVCLGTLHLKQHNTRSHCHRQADRGTGLGASEVLHCAVAGLHALMDRRSAFQR
jgi:hypothetical protein